VAARGTWYSLDAGAPFACLDKQDESLELVRESEPPAVLAGYREHLGLSAGGGLPGLLGRTCGRRRQREGGGGIGYGDSIAGRWLGGGSWAPDSSRAVGRGCVGRRGEMFYLL
jgi:hypothetical protein